MLRHFKKLDWILIGAAVFLTALGLVSIYSSSSGVFFNFTKQLIFLGIGLMAMFSLSFLDYRILRENSYLILILYVVCILSLVGLFFFAPEIRGVQRWYKIGPFSADPVEFAKIILIVLLAKYFSMRHLEMYRFRHILFSGAYVLIPGLLIFFQPDLGSILILIAVWAAVLFISGINLRHFLILSFCGFLIFAFCWGFLMKDYQKERIVSFAFPHTHYLEGGWSQAQARIAIGSGGFLGQGLLQGSQTQYGFLPETQTDFIFAAVAEEMGFLGVAFLLAALAIIIWRILKLGRVSESNFSRLFTVGFSALLMSQAFINIGMNLGLLPVVGIPLPFVSYGGSSLIAFFVGLGILQSIKVRGG